MIVYPPLSSCTYCPDHSTGNDGIKSFYFRYAGRTMHRAARPLRPRHENRALLRSN